MKRTYVLILPVLIMNVGMPTVPGKEFSARIVDGLGRPVPGVVVDVTWNKSGGEAKVRTVSLLKLRSDENGMVRGTYDEKVMTAEGFAFVELSKKGYAARVQTGPFRAEYVLRREFHGVDLVRIPKLDDKARTQEVKELIAGDFNDDLLERKIFEMDHVFRPALRDLVQDRQVGLAAIGLLAFIGVPEDLAWVVQHTPAPRKEWLENRWAYYVVSAMLEPATEAEWAFLKRCAEGEFDDPEVEAGAIQTLALIASPKSRQVLEALHPKDKDLASSVADAITYTRSNLVPFSDRNLVGLGGRVAAAIKVGKLRRAWAPRYNEKRDKALIDLDFSEGRESITFTATFHEAGGLWKLRGVRVTMLGTLKVPTGAEEDKK